MKSDLKNKIPAIITIIAGAFCVIAIVRAWIDCSESCSAIDLVSNTSKWFDQDNQWKAYLPLLTVIIGFIAQVLAVHEITGPVMMKKRTFDIIYIVAGALILVLCIVFITSDFNYAGNSQAISDHIGTGAYMELVGAAIILIVGILRIIGIFGIKQGSEIQQTSDEPAKKE